MSVLIYAEQWDGKFKKQTFELVSYGVRVAEMMNTQPIVLCIGTLEQDELRKLGKFGVRKAVYYLGEQLKTFDNQLYTLLIAKAVEKYDATVILLSNNNTGKAIAPRLSVRLRAAVGSGVNQVPEGIDPFIIRKKVFSGSTFGRIVLNTPVKILTLAQNSFEIVPKETDILLEQFQFDLPVTPIATSVLETQKQTGKILLSDAEIVVSGGRGMKSPDNWGPLVELADLLGAATACSRPVSDEGWRPHEEHTGQTGKVIAPNLYFAIGISGATQHLAGVSSSKFIVAINTDKDAPIFSAAQYGIVGDAGKVLPKLVEAVKEIKGK